MKHLRCHVCHVELPLTAHSGTCQKHATISQRKRWTAEKEMLAKHPLNKIPVNLIAKHWNVNHPLDFSATYQRYEEFISPKGLRTQP